MTLDSINSINNNQLNLSLNEMSRIWKPYPRLIKIIERK